MGWNSKISTRIRYGKEITRIIGINTQKIRSKSYSWCLIIRKIEDIRDDESWLKNIWSKLTKTIERWGKWREKKINSKKVISDIRKIKKRWHAKISIRCKEN